MPRIIIRLPTVIFVVMLMLVEGSALSLVPLLAAAVHEMGHMAVLMMLGYGIDSVEITFFGAEIKLPDNIRSALGAVLMYSAGSAANLICGVAVDLIPNGGMAAELFSVSCYALAAVNMLPIQSLDGGCVLATISRKLLPDHTEKILQAASGLTLTALWLIGSYLLLTAGGNLSLMLFCIYLFVTLYVK